MFTIFFALPENPKYAIKRSGGKCIVQAPEEAAFDDMPNSVLRNMEVDYNDRSKSKS